MQTDVISDARVVVLSTPVVWFMALAAALGTATIYPLQPAIADVAGSLHASLTAIGVALACGPLGYLVGLALLVPLVDRFAPRHVLSTQFGALATALAVNALAGKPWLLGLVIGVVGAGSSVGAQLSSVAGRFANPRRRATVLGIVTAGISAGILAGRIVGGWLNDEIGWRIGGYAFAGLLGIVATRVAGAWTDGVGALLVGLVVAVAAAATLGACLANTAMTLACLGLFDAGLFAAQVANQSTVLAIDPAAPAQLNSAYMLVYFVGGSLGTAFGAAAVGWVGWPATTAVAACAISLALIVTVAVRPDTRSLG
jgi:predicted MFS family arabinose efflux permease